ncbi:hypothetical protein TNCV_2130781 [Trichonephila clavipes]|nr:hypothetical protein TNCV_2130781 [Trichonephila clavipes]
MDDKQAAQKLFYNIFWVKAHNNNFFNDVADHFAKVATAKDVEVSVPAPRSYVIKITTRGLLATDLVLLNHGQVTRTTPELEPPLLTTTPTVGRLSSR